MVSLYLSHSPLEKSDLGLCQQHAKVSPRAFLDSFVATKVPNSRIPVMLACLVPFLAGVIGLWLVDKSRPYGRLVCLWISFTYTATWTLSMSVVTAHTAGHTKKITTNAVLLIGYCLGNFIGPFFFKAEQAPVYNLGVGMMFFCIGVQVLALAGLWTLFWVRNKRRNALVAGLSPEETVGVEQRAYEMGFQDITDLRNPYFKVSGQNSTGVDSVEVMLITAVQYVY
jgi:MFS transporter, ACS family, allantoate permease